MAAPLHLLLVLFVSSGVMQPLLISTLGYNGAYDKSTLLFLLPNYVGMSLAGLLKRDVFGKGTFRKRKLAILCSVDVVSQGLCQYGLAVAGSSLYIVIYSSTTIWIALLSRIVIRRKLSSGQWIGCCIVVAGLAITGGNLASQLSDRSNAEIALGAGMILFGSVSHAYTWVLVELLLGESDPVPPEAVSTVMGVAGVGTFCAWQLICTLPRADQLVFDVIRAHGGHNDVIALSYLLLTLASLVHAVTFYHLVGRMGAVTAGVLKGCQAVAVFIGSHFFFCEAQESQCFSVFKAWSLVLVLLGTATYALSRGSRDNVGRHVASGDGERDSGGDVEHHGKCCCCCCCCCCGNGGSGGDSKAECAGCFCCYCCCPPTENHPDSNDDAEQGVGDSFTAIYQPFSRQYSDYLYSDPSAQSAVPSPALLRRSLSRGLETSALMDGPAALTALHDAESAFDMEEAVMRANALLERAQRASFKEQQSVES